MGSHVASRVHADCCAKLTKCDTQKHSGRVAAVLSDFSALQGERGGLSGRHGSIRRRHCIRRTA
jgi:hypothetical protein